MAGICTWIPMSSAWPREEITVTYNERPPYLISKPDGSVTGLTGTPAANAFRDAGIPIVWSKVPTNRQIALTKDSSYKSCAIGWFRNSEREQFAKFTNPIYRDRPTVILANNQFRVKDHDRLDAILRAPGVQVLVKQLFSYGPYIDGLLAELKPAIVSTSSENTQMLQMIQANRADFMFVSEEEASYLIEQAGFKSKDFQLVHLSDMPIGEKRHVMCSKQVSDDIIDRLNKAIKFKDELAPRAETKSKAIVP